MLRDIELLATKVNWDSVVRHLFCSLGFYDVWVQQGVGDYSKFISVLKQRLNDNFIQNWRARLEESPRATFYKSIAAFQPWDGSNEITGQNYTCFCFVSSKLFFLFWLDVFLLCLLCIFVLYVF